MRFADKTALITGGNSGIGLATARLMRAEGGHVAITGRDQAKLDAAAAELGQTVLANTADLDDRASISAMVTTVADAFGTLNIQFANAGISGPSPLGSTTREAFELIFRTNVTGVFFTVQECLPLMRSGGSIVLNGSVMGQLGMPGTAAYSASKAAVTGMAKVFAGELATRGIGVNTVVPGGTVTPIWTRGARAGIPMARLSLAEEVAQAVLFLASDASSGMTGAEIVVTGRPAPRLAPRSSGDAGMIAVYGCYVLRLTFGGCLVDHEF